MAELNAKLLEKFEAKAQNDPKTKLIRNALYKSSLANLALDGEELAKTNFLFNV